MSQQILSQDEVDALLQGISGEDPATDSKSEQGGGVREYNLANQERIVTLESQVNTMGKEIKTLKEMARRSRRKCCLIPRTRRNRFRSRLAQDFART